MSDESRESRVSLDKALGKDENPSLDTIKARRARGRRVVSLVRGVDHADDVYDM